MFLKNFQLYILQYSSSAPLTSNTKLEDIRKLLTSVPSIKNKWDNFKFEMLWGENFSSSSHSQNSEEHDGKYRDQWRRRNRQRNGSNESRNGRGEYDQGGRQNQRRRNNSCIGCSYY